MIWIIWLLDLSITSIIIKECYESRRKQIDALDFNPCCRDCNLPEGMDW